MIKRIFVLIMVWCLLGPALPVLANTEIVDCIVAVVNDDIITLSQLNKITQPYRDQIAAASDKPEEVKRQMIESMQRDILHRLIDRVLIRQEASRHQISVSDSDVQTAIDNSKRQNNLDQQSLERGLESEGITWEEYQERIREDIMQSMLINRAVRSKVIVTLADIEAYYEAHPEEFKGGRKYYLRNILLETREESQKVISALEQRLPFPEAARRFSTAPNADEGGDLGEFNIDHFSDDIRNAVKPLKKGEYSQPIQTDRGHQILYVEDILEPSGKSLDQAKEEIQDILYLEQAEQKFSQWSESLKKNAYVKIML